MRIEAASFARQFVRTCNDGWLQGWHECNGGNLSYLLRKGEVNTVRGTFDPGAWQALPCGITVENLAGRFVMVTAAGSHFRDVVAHPKRTSGIIEIAHNGQKWRPCWGFSHHGAPTSELPSHLIILNARRQLAGKQTRVVYHCHPANMIALTFVLPLDEDELTRRLTEMISECKLVFPHGLGMLGWMEPGSLELGFASVERLHERDAVIWSHHGLICTGSSFAEAFGLAHTIEKAAEILVKTIAMKGIA